LNKIIRLTEFDLVKIVKKVINENGPAAAIRKIIAPAFDDLVRAFGDDTARSLESVLSRAISNPGVNMTEKQGVLYLKSLKGGEIKVESVKKALDAVSQGLIPIENVLNTLPRNLADGSEFRSYFQNVKPKASSQVAGQKISQSSFIPSSQIPQKEQVRLLGILDNSSFSKAWLYFGTNPNKYSGWKFHVYGEDLYDSAYLYDKLLPVTQKWGAYAKVGVGAEFLPGTVQWGKKGATIYIPPEVIKNGKQTELLSDIQSAIGGYNKKGTIQGDKSITDNITYRYELSGEIPYGEGINYNQYKEMYTSNTGGSYKPNNVPDLFGQ
jgi:hypothetical protein